MSQLKIYPENESKKPLLEAEDGEKIAAELAKVGVLFERWQAKKEIENNASNEEIIAAYREDIQKLIEKSGYQTYDVINVNPDIPEKEKMRQKFLSEHTHADDEIRFFVKGKGLFSLHIKDKVYQILCEKNDLISVPANTPHWFDMGEKPSFSCIRLFDSPAGWVADYTGSKIAAGFDILN